MTGYALSGRAVAITGAAGGLGAALAQALCARGAQVALLDRDADRVRAQAAKLGGPAVARGWAADVRDLDDLTTVMAEVRAHFGRLDVAVAGAGILGPVAGLQATDPADWDRVIEINLGGVWRTLRAAAPYVSEQRGHLLAMSSKIGFLHPPLMSAYAASKAGVWALCDSLRLELRPAGVTVGSVHPTIFRTPMTASGFDAPAATALVGDLGSGVFKSAPLETVVADIVRGIERRSSRVVTPRRFTAAQYAPGLLQAAADRTYFRPSGIRQAIELATEDPTMKSFQVVKYKAPIEARDVAEPTVGDHDVLVDIHAAGVNVLDSKLRDAEFKLLLPYKPPFTLGHDLAGIVTKTGAAVTRFSVGDAVYGRVRDHRIGTFAERIAAHEDDLARKPEALTMAEAASVPLVGLTAWQALVERADLKPGQRVLIHAGSGGVGTWAIQLAKHLGATVTTTTGTSNLEWVRELGADTVIDYRTQDFENVAQDNDVVLDSQGGETLSKSIRTLKPGGIAIGIAGPPDAAFARQQQFPRPLRPVMSLLSLKTRRAADRQNARYSFLFMTPSGHQLEQLTTLIDDGPLRPVIDRAFPFDQTPEALAYVDAGRAKGKVVIVSKRHS